MNVKRAAATAAAVIGALLLVVAVGVGYLAGHSTSSARAGGSTIAQAAGHTHGAAGTAAPATATLDDQIYGDGFSASNYGDGVGVPGGTVTGSGDRGTGDGVPVGVTDFGGTATGTVTPAIYGD